MRTRVGARLGSGRLRSRTVIKLAVPSNVRLRISDRDFWELCQENRDLRLERSEKGVLEAMPPTSGGTGAKNADLTAQVVVWAKIDGTGTPFDSSAGFKLPNGATRSPDTSWIPHERWNALTVAEKEEQFSPICPEFVIELRSRSDRKQKLQAKMRSISLREHVWAGSSIRDGTVEIYRPGQPVEILNKPAELSGEDILPGFVLDLKGILFD